MAKTKVLIAVKTYPTLASKYDELFVLPVSGKMEHGSAFIPFRSVNSITTNNIKIRLGEIDLIRNDSDFRPESHRPYSIENAFDIVGHIDTTNNWQLRKEIVLKNVYTNSTH